METAFTPLASAVGGALIGLSAVLLLAVEGRIAGISGIVARLWGPAGQAARAAVFLAGLAAAPVLLGAAGAGPFAFAIDDRPALLAVGGLLTGLGAALGAGCTSGHGICGLARLSPRSAVAVVVFMATAAATVFVARHLVGPA